MDHRWSGWPGAWCLDCGIEDQREICLADHDHSLICINDHVGCTTCPPGLQCVLHVNPPCPEPYSRRFDPYQKHAGE